jgi:hypothetical protein
MKILIINVLCVLSLMNAAPVEESVGEYGNHYEGDIILTPEQEEAIEKNGRDGRTGIIDTRRRWPKVNGLVYMPYVIDSQSGYCKLFFR